MEKVYFSKALKILQQKEVSTLRGVFITGAPEASVYAIALFFKKVFADLSASAETFRYIGFEDEDDLQVVEEEGGSLWGESIFFIESHHVKGDVKKKNKLTAILSKKLSQARFIIKLSGYSWEKYLRDLKNISDSLMWISTYEIDAYLRPSLVDFYRVALGQISIETWKKRKSPSPLPEGLGGVMGEDDIFQFCRWLDVDENIGGAKSPPLPTSDVSQWPILFFERQLDACYLEMQRAQLSGVFWTLYLHFFRNVLDKMLRPERNTQLYPKVFSATVLQKIRETHYWSFLRLKSLEDSLFQLEWALKKNSQLDPYFSLKSWVTREIFLK